MLTAGQMIEPLMRRPTRQDPAAQPTTKPVLWNVIEHQPSRLVDQHPIRRFLAELFDQ